MLLGRLAVPERLTDLDGSGGCLDIFSVVCLFSLIPLFLWEMA